MLPGQLLQQRNAFFGRLVRQHGAADDVDALDARAETFVHEDLTIRIGPDATCIKPQTLGVGPPPDCDQDAIRRQRLTGIVGGGFDFEGDMILLQPGSENLLTEAEFEAFALKGLVQLGRQLPVHVGRDAVEVLDDRHFRAEPPPDGTQHQVDVASTNHDQVIRHPVERQRSRGRDDPPLVNLDSRQRGAVRPCRDDDAAALHPADLGPSAERHLDRLGIDQPASTDQARHAVLLEEVVNSLAQIIDDRFLVPQQPTQVDTQFLEQDAVLAELVLGSGITLAGFQQGLSRPLKYLERTSARRLTKALI